MVTGWFLDSDGSYYYLNPSSDGTKGRMLTDWAWIAGAGRCSEVLLLQSWVSDGYRGRMAANTVVEGYTVNADGAWTIDGVVQTR